MSVYLSRSAFTALKSVTSKNVISELIVPQCRQFSLKTDNFAVARCLMVRKYSSDTIQPTIALDNAGIPLKKKVVHKKATPADLSHKEGHYLTMAYATANAYDLKSLKEALVQQKLYEPGT